MCQGLVNAQERDWAVPSQPRPVRRRWCHRSTRINPRQVLSQPNHHEHGHCACHRHTDPTHHRRRHCARACVESPGQKQSGGRSVGGSGWRWGGGRGACSCRGGTPNSGYDVASKPARGGGGGGVWGGVGDRGAGVPAVGYRDSWTLNGCRGHASRRWRRCGGSTSAVAEWVCGGSTRWNEGGRAMGRKPHLSCCK